ncbi:hypothetical protein [Dyella lutea]|uniref:Uncharacterized protein n=1 Tax=Dyella lutea TaxID=2950441 RepID=A0ABT1FF79_9GAMM|nr:hypothetical protein [Dyella lutea]MCP1376041.1 hypothetical protein [Dyella lutea]
MSADPSTTSKTVEVVVAAGRSVVDADGALCRAGETAKVVHSELKRLRALGFIAEKGEKVDAGASGPKLSASEGPTVRLA